MLDHIGLPVSDYARSLAFYKAVFAPLGYGLVMEVTPDMTGDGSSAAGFGSGNPISGSAAAISKRACTSPWLRLSQIKRKVFGQSRLDPLSSDLIRV